MAEGIFELVKTAICLTWSPADNGKCTGCSTDESFVSRFQPLGLATVLQIMNLEWLDGNASQPSPTPSRKIQLASHAVQHISWDICSSADITNLTEFVVRLIKKVDPLSVTFLRCVATFPIIVRQLKFDLDTASIYLRSEN